jgi:hypothetical protein
MSVSASVELFSFRPKGAPFRLPSVALEWLQCSSRILWSLHEAAPGLAAHRRQGCKGAARPRKSRGEASIQKEEQDFPLNIANMPPTGQQKAIAVGVPSP